MSLGLFYKGESLALQFDLADESGAAVVCAELDELLIILKVNQKTQVVLAKSEEEIEEGSEAGAVVIEVESEETAKWPTGKLTAELVLTLDGKNLIAKAELYQVRNSEFSDR